MTAICPSCGRTVADRAPCMSCPAEPEEHRGSRMPDLIREAASDPLFADAAFREFTPEEAEMVREKAKGVSAEMRPRIERHLGGRN